MPEQVPEQRRLAAIMFTDMVGYSALSQRDEAAALRLLNEQRRLLREAFAACGGREIEAVGDGFFVEFASALAAGQCAVQIQQKLHERNAALPAAQHIKVRIGIHLGDVVVQDTRVHGDGVNIAARIEPLAEPGGICISEDVARQVQNKLALPLRRLGRADLKNIRLPIAIYRIVLPWQPRRIAGMESLAFSVRHRPMRRSILAMGAGLCILGGVGFWTAQREQTGKAANNRLAVLPFRSLSASADDEYFVDGMTEEMIARLSKVRGLEVIARTSVAAYKGTTKHIREIGTELDVSTVLEGSVRRAGSQVRITAQLINVERDAPLWSSEYDRSLEDIFTVQRDIAEQVAAALAMTLAPADAGARPVGPGDAADLEAYNDYLRARFYLNRGTREDLQQAVSHFERALERVPTYALAYAGLADALGNLANYERAKTAALRAIELDPSLAEAHSALGIVKAFYEHDLASAEAEFRRALDLNPNSAMTLDWYSFYLLFFPRWEEAIAMQRRAVQLDPLSIIINADLGWVLSHAGRWDEAIEHLRRALELDPSNRVLLTALGMTYIGKGLYREALATFQTKIDRHGTDPDTQCAVAQAYALSGDVDRAKRMLAEVSGDDIPRAAGPWNVAAAYRAIAVREPGHDDDMFFWLEKAFEEHSLGLVFVSSVEWSQYRSDPRMLRLRDRLGLQAWSA
jgi:adenylate cyclase